MFNVFLTVFLFVTVFLTWAMLGLIRREQKEEAEKNLIFKKGVLQHLEEIQENEEATQKILTGRVATLLLDILGEVHETKKPKTKTNKKKAEKNEKSEAVTAENREDLEKL